MQGCRGDFSPRCDMDVLFFVVFWGFGVVAFICRSVARCTPRGNVSRTRGRALCSKYVTISLGSVSLFRLLALLRQRYTLSPGRHLRPLTTQVLGYGDKDKRPLGVCLFKDGFGHSGKLIG
jgi:hypothetical protein